MTVNGSLRIAKRGLSLLIALFMLFGLVGSFRITASAFSYVDAVLKADNPTTEAKMLVAALYQFHEAEVAYRNSMN